MTSDVDELTRIFQHLGAEDPEGWAKSQIDQGIPQLHRFLFLKKAWALVVDEEDDSWIDRVIEAWRRLPEEPYSGQGRALDRMLALGVERSDIVELVRTAQAELIFGLCYQLEDPDISDEEEEHLDTFGWALVATEGDDEPTSQVINGLHESVLEMDPTGREMRPPPSNRKFNGS